MSGQTLDNREQANDGLRASHAGPPPLPGESLVSALPACRPASVMRHPAEGGGLCQLRLATHTANTQTEGETSHKHILSPSLPLFMIHTHTSMSAVSNQLAGRCLLMPHISSHVWPAAKIGDQSLFTEEMAVCGRKMRGKRGGTQ